MNRQSPWHRIDAFADAAFAFAASLLLLGGAALPDSHDQMRDALARVPAFALGFAIIAMFWSAHVRWRRLAGPDGFASIFLTLVLIFLVLVYVIPLRLASAAATAFAGLGHPGSAGMGEVRLAELFAIYGAGFAAMALAVAGLFGQARRTGPRPAEAATEEAIHLILAAAGLVSGWLALMPGTVTLAPWVYPLIGPAIGLYLVLAGGRDRPTLPPGPRGR
ncbi:MAG: TMEM175 family protein [Sphingomonadaceae bacterium]